jgi:hypothetical protein
MIGFARYAALPLLGVSQHKGNRPTGEVPMATM